jgi:hypothetical protein
MQKLLSIGLLSAALFTVSAAQPAHAKAVRSPDPSVKCDKCRQWVRVDRTGPPTKGQLPYYYKRAAVCPECRQVARGESPTTLPATCKTCGGTVHRAMK